MRQLGFQARVYWWNCGDRMCLNFGELGVKSTCHSVAGGRERVTRQVMRSLVHIHSRRVQGESVRVTRGQHELGEYRMLIPMTLNVWVRHWWRPREPFLDSVTIIYSRIMLNESNLC